MNPKEFILTNTSPKSCLNLTDIKLYQTNEVHELWHKTQDEMDLLGMAPPFWAFPWAGGEGLARYILENPHEVLGKNVLDFASGSGLVAIAAKKAGARSVIANDIDPLAIEAVKLNAALNNVVIETLGNNIVDSDNLWDVVLAGDIFYEKAMAETIMEWFYKLSQQGAKILAGDPGRAYVPRDKMVEKACYRIVTSTAIEDVEFKNTKIFQVDGASLSANK